MNYVEHVGLDGNPDITFLYKLIRGVVGKSHGVNVARMARFPVSILQIAQSRSRGLEEEAGKRALGVK